MTKETNYRLNYSKMIEIKYDGNSIVLYFYENSNTKLGYSFVVDFGNLFYDDESEQGIFPSLQFPVKYDDGRTAWDNPVIIPDKVRFELEYAMQMFEDYMAGELTIPYDEERIGSCYLKEEVEEFVSRMKEFNLR